MVENSKKLIALCVSLAIVLFFIACNGDKSTPDGGDSALVGRWLLEDGYDIYGQGGRGNIELLKDGSGIYYDHFGIEWKIGNGRLHFFGLSSGVRSFNYKITDTTLTLTDDKGEKSSKYKRK